MYRLSSKAKKQGDFKKMEVPYIHDLIHNKKDNLIKIFIVSLFLSFTLCFFLPTVLYYNNLLEFPFTYSDVFFRLILITIVFFILVFSGLLLIRQIFLSPALLFLSILGILIWLQSTVFVWNYGPFDGTPKIWENYTLFGILEILIYLSIVAICYNYRIVFTKNIQFIFAALLITQIFILAPLFMNLPSEPIYKGYYYSNENQFQFSTQQNIILLILDDFQSDGFNEIIFDNRTSVSEFDGFIYYRNAAGNFPTTRAALPSLLSEEYYINEEPFVDYLKERAYPKYISKILKDEGYNAGIYDTFYPHPEIASNVKRFESLDNSIAALYSLVSFRISPHFGKMVIYDHFDFTSDLLDKKKVIQFNNNLINKTTFTNTTKIFKLYHLETPHPPYQLNESFQITELPNTRGGYITQSIGSLVVVKELIRQLKKTGAYNQSMILVIGDHGAGLSSNQTLTGHKSEIEMINANMGAGIPLILIKPFNNSGPLLISDKPVSLSDIPTTISEEIRITNNTYSGISMIKNQSSENRSRRYYEYQWEQSGWYSAYLPPIKEYLITGHSWRYQSWKPSGKVFTDGGIQYINNTYPLSTPIYFTQGGSSGNYTFFGWSTPEQYFTWTDGNFAMLALTLDNPKTDLILKVTGSPFIRGGNISDQQVSVYVNNHYLTDWTFLAHERKVASIPYDFMDNESVMSISFSIPYAISPSALNISEDPRALGIAVEKIQIFPKMNYKIGDSIVFSKNGTPDSFIISGFSDPEENYTWTDGRVSMIGLQVPVVNRDLIITMKATPFLGNGSIDGQPVSVSANGHKIADWNYLRTEQMVAHIPPGIINQSHRMVITFEIPNAESPENAGISKDARLLGLAIEEIRID